MNDDPKVHPRDWEKKKNEYSHVAMASFSAPSFRHIGPRLAWSTIVLTEFGITLLLYSILLVQTNPLAIILI